MNARGRIVLTLAFLVSGWAGARAEDSPDARRWWSHVLFLADDKLEGRATGSQRGHRRKAAAYVAAEFDRIGLTPAGTKGYFQPVELRSTEIVEEQIVICR